MFKEDYQYKVNTQSQQSLQNYTSHDFVRINNGKLKGKENLTKSKKWGNQLLSECKAVIQQQFQQLSLLSEQIQRKASIIQANIQEKQNLKATIVHLQKNLIDKAQRITSLQQKLKTAVQDVVRLTKLLHQNQQQRELLRTSLATHNQQHQKTKQQNSKLQTKINTLNQNMYALEQAICHMNNENHHLNQMIYSKQIQSKLEIQNLKKFNESLKKKFQILELDGFSEVASNHEYSSYGMRNQSTNLIAQSPEKGQYFRKRAYSTEKKRISPNYYNPETQNKFNYDGKLINNPYRNSLKAPQTSLLGKSPNIQRYADQTNYKYQHQAKPKHQSQRKPFFVTQFSPIINPGMTQQLNNIKQHISREYKRIASKKNNINSRTKQRGLKVLQALQRKAWRLVSQAEKSDQQSDSVQ